MPMVHTIWFVTIMSSESFLEPAYSQYFITAYYDQSYAYEVRSSSFAMGINCDTQESGAVVGCPTPFVRSPAMTPSTLAFSYDIAFCPLIA